MSETPITDAYLRRREELHCHVFREDLEMMRELEVEAKKAWQAANEFRQQASEGFEARDEMLGAMDHARMRLCAVGLHGGHYSTLPEAVEGVLEIVAALRRDLHDPPADVCEAVMEKMRTEVRSP